MSKNMNRFVFLFVALTCCFLALSGIASAQNNKATIVGTVADPNGAVVANAKVVVTNTATGEARDVTTNDGGDYAITNLLPGVYKVTVEAKGFKTMVYPTVTVETNARVPLDVKFTEISGTGANIVTVTTDAAPLA